MEVCGVVQAGHVAVYGDSNCLDSSHQRSSCYNLLIRLIQYASEVSLHMYFLHDIMLHAALNHGCIVHMELR